MSRTAPEFTVSSVVAAEPVEVWRHAVSPSGVNSELRPLLRMTFPAGTTDLTAGWRPGERLFRSWILLLGVIPVEFDDLVFEEVERGQRFLERSALLSQRVWQHERVIEEAPGGCRVTDRLRFEPRVGWLAAMHRPAFRAVFAWRHRRLRSIFGEPPA